MSVRRTLAAALAAGLLLTGCTDEPEPEFTPTETPSPSVTESETAQPEAQSPEEFIETWFELSMEMQVTGETDALRAASKGCATCTDLADRVDRIYEAGGNIQLASQQVLRIEPGAQSADLKQFDVTIRTSRTVFQESADTEPDRYPGGEATYQATIVKRGNEWLMNALQVL